MDHEHRVSKSYSPVGLGEILQKRSFTSLDQVSGLSKNSDKNRPLIVRPDGQLVQSEDNAWDPRSLLAVIDGVQAVGWAMIFEQWADEEDINLYIDWFIRIARKNAKMLNQVKEYWDHSSWTLAVAMRGQTIGLNLTFKQATAEIMSDLSAMNNIFIAVPSPTPTPTSTAQAKGVAPEEGAPQDEPWPKKKKKGDCKGKQGKGNKVKGKENVWTSPGPEEKAPEQEPETKRRRNGAGSSPKLGTSPTNGTTEPMTPPPGQPTGVNEAEHPDHGAPVTEPRRGLAGFCNAPIAFLFPITQ
ncbi:unnamed protein product [Polarella glacialis]|uniref:Uncharacterized protein n=1 Tax=Polarella glacialis TaxID=89957 RepID=A0A813G4D5_POLGL|nr:unnamed protein product [Polarella glacialis]